MISTISEETHPMSSDEHVEKHFHRDRRRARYRYSECPTVLLLPFALAAGLTGAVASTAIVVTAGFAEIAAGSIAMGLGGYLAAKTDSEHYASERQRGNSRDGGTRRM